MTASDGTDCQSRHGPGGSFTPRIVSGRSHTHAVALLSASWNHASVWLGVENVETNFEICPSSPFLLRGVLTEVLSGSPPSHTTLASCVRLNVACVVYMCWRNAECRQLAHVMCVRVSVCLCLCPLSICGSSPFDTTTTNHHQPLPPLADPSKVAAPFLAVPPRSNLTRRTLSFLTGAVEATRWCGCCLREAMGLPTLFWRTLRLSHEYVGRRQEDGRRPPHHQVRTGPHGVTPHHHRLYYHHHHRHYHTHSSAAAAACGRHSDHGSRVPVHHDQSSEICLVHNVAHFSSASLTACVLRATSDLELGWESGSEPRRWGDGESIKDLHLSPEVGTVWAECDLCKKQVDQVSHHFITSDCVLPNYLPVD